MNKPIRIAVLGLGRAGMINHIESFRLLPDMYQVTGVYDLEEKRVGEVARQLGARPFFDATSLLTDPSAEVVVIATPSHLHYEQTCQALSEGKDVICEKPMAASFEEAEQMVRRANEKRRLLAVFHNARFAPDFQQVKQVVDSGLLGRIVEIRMCWNGYSRREDWQTLRSHGGGVLRNTGPHPIDHALQFLPAGVLSVSAHLEHVLSTGDAEDHLHLWIRSEHGGPLIDLEISSIDAYGSDRWHVLGSHGGLVGSGLQLKWKHRSAAVPSSWVEHEWQAPANGPSLSYQFYRHFFESYRQRRKACIGMEEALRVMEVIAQATHAAGWQDAMAIS